MIELILKLILGTAAGGLAPRLEPPDPEEMEIDFGDPESVLRVAARYEHVGEWDRALALYGFVQRAWPQEYGCYARNCVEATQEKIDRVCMATH